MMKHNFLCESSLVVDSDENITIRSFSGENVSFDFVNTFQNLMKTKPTEFTTQFANKVNIYDELVSLKISYEKDKDSFSYQIEDFSKIL